MTIVQEYLSSPSQHPHEELALRVPMSMRRAICRIFAFPQKRNFWGWSGSPPYCKLMTASISPCASSSMTSCCLFPSITTKKETWILSVTNLTLCSHSKKCVKWYQKLYYQNTATKSIGQRGGYLTFYFSVCCYYCYTCSTGTGDTGSLTKLKCATTSTNWLLFWSWHGIVPLRVSLK